MKFLSLQLLLQEFLRVIRRFPLVLLAACCGTAALIVLAEAKHPNHSFENQIGILAMSAHLAMVYYLAATLYCRWRNKSILYESMLQLAVTVFAFVFYFFIARDVEQTSTWLRFFLFSAAAHLLVACSAYGIKNRHLEAFWDFNKALFLRILQSALYTGVLFLGLAGALRAIQELFSVSIPGERYLELWIIMVGIFNSVFFLAGIPEKTDEEPNYSYPKGLKIFVQYVLVPLVSIYLIILLAYEIKIALQGSLPEGWVSNLVLAYGVAGILSILLVFPIRQLEGNNWIRFFSRWFYLALLPLLILLFLAIGVRIQDYGITEERYYVLALAIWLLGITIYFILPGRSNIKYIPASLALLHLLAALGPQSAFNVSRRSQQKELAQLLEEYKILQNGKVQAEHDSIPLQASKRISSITDYLLENHGISSLQSFFSEDLGSMADKIGLLKNDRYSFHFTLRDSVMSKMGLNYTDQYQYPEHDINHPFNYQLSEEMLPTYGCRYLLSTGTYHSNGFYKTYLPGDSLLKAYSDGQGDDVKVKWQGNTYTFSLDTLQKNTEYYYLRKHQSSFQGGPILLYSYEDPEGRHLLLMLQHLSATKDKKDKSRVRINNLSFYILLK